MPEPTPKPVGGWLLLAVFAAPLVLAGLLNAVGWRPPATRNAGELVEPPTDLKAGRFVLSDGSALGWMDADWTWTVFALPGAACAERCMGRLDELRRVRVSLNQNQDRVRVVVLDPALAARLVPLAPLFTARGEPAALAALRPKAGDDLAAAIVDPRGFLVLRYPAGYDARGLRKDLAKLVRG